MPGATFKIINNLFFKLLQNKKRTYKSALEVLRITYHTISKPASLRASITYSCVILEISQVSKAQNIAKTLFYYVLNPLFIHSLWFKIRSKNMKYFIEQTNGK